MPFHKVLGRFSRFRFLLGRARGLPAFFLQLVQAADGVAALGVLVAAVKRATAVALLGELAFFALGTGDVGFLRLVLAVAGGQLEFLGASVKVLDLVAVLGQDPAEGGDLFVADAPRRTRPFG